MKEATIKTILYIEDESDHIEVVKVLVESNDFRVIVAQDGESGLKNVFEHKPDLVLMDLTLPKLHGLEVLKKIKANSETKHIPVFILTASGKKNSEQECRDCGAQDFLRKPYDSRELLSKIKRILKKASD